MAIKLPKEFLSNLPFLKSKETIAIDIGTAAIKVLQLKASGNRYALQKWGVLPLENAAREDFSPQERNKIIVSLLADYLAREKVATKNVVASVSGNQVIVRYVRFPKLTREELNKTIQFEAEPYIPFDIRDVDLSFQLLDDVVEDGQKKMNAILVAAKKEITQPKLDLLNELNLRPVVMDIDVFALSNAYDVNADAAAAETVLAVNVGASVTNMSIIENHVPRVVRDVAIAGNSFTKAIQKSLGCDLAAAETLKTAHALLLTAEEKEKMLAENQKEAIQVSAAILPAAKELVGEIQRSIDFYVSQNAERSVHRVLLSGGSVRLGNLNAYIAQELKLPVELFDPMKNIFGAELIPADERLQFAVAVGLAVRRENDVAKK